MEAIAKERFEPIPKNIQAGQIIGRKPLSYWQDAWRRLRMNRVAMASMWVLLFIFLVAIIGPVLFPQYRENHLNETLMAPNAKYWFGTDDLGRDNFARVLRGSRISLFIGLTVAFISLIIGVLYGGISGYIGGWLDSLMMRIIDILITIPDMIILILLLVVLKPGVGTLILALSLTSWTSMARLVRGQVLQLKEQEFILAARVLGAGTWRIILRHLIPNALSVIIVRFTMSIPGIIFSEAFLSYIGLGIRIPEASWGNLASQGAQQFPSNLWLFFIPAAFICVTMLAFNLFGDGLRDALDPKMRK
ncbi:MAG TPA: diguanylate cyclase [Clostridiales bacterium]|nr:diguanylate cyclase [Clostridiales bacterium]